MTVIYHGTPLTPRSALNEVCAGRAMCVSFFRPDDVEAVEAISPDIMFRQWRVFDVEGCTEGRERLVRKVGLVRLLRLARAAIVPTWSLGSHPRYAWGTIPAQRRALATMAVWAKGRTAMAHGRANRAVTATVRQIRPGVSRLDWQRQAPRPTRISRENGRGGAGLGQSMACPTHDARDQGRFQLPVCERGRDHIGAERMAL